MPNPGSPPRAFDCTSIYRSAGTIQSHLPSRPTTVHRLGLHLMSLGEGRSTRPEFDSGGDSPSEVYPTRIPPRPVRPRQIPDVGKPVPRRGSTGRESTLRRPAAAPTPSAMADDDGTHLMRIRRRGSQSIRRRGRSQPSHSLRRRRRPCRSLTRSRTDAAANASGDTLARTPSRPFARSFAVRSRVNPPPTTPPTTPLTNAAHPPVRAGASSWTPRRRSRTRCAGSRNVGARRGMSFASA